jgi:hypothetical protein
VILDSESLNFVRVLENQVFCQAVTGGLINHLEDDRVTRRHLDRKSKSQSIGVGPWRRIESSRELIQLLRLVSDGVSKWLHRWQWRVSAIQSWITA